MHRIFTTLLFTETYKNIFVTIIFKSHEAYNQKTLIKVYVSVQLNNHRDMAEHLYVLALNFFQLAMVKAENSKEKTCFEENYKMYFLSYLCSLWKQIYKKILQHEESNIPSLQNRKKRPK